MGYNSIKEEQLEEWNREWAKKQAVADLYLRRGGYGTGGGHRVFCL